MAECWDLWNEDVEVTAVPWLTVTLQDIID